jgi:cytochrome c-type biogenesis protein CcmH/NrfG
MFVFLALVFGVGFVFFGVGGGIPGTSLGDILGNHSASSGPSASDLRDRIAKNPKDAAAYRDLATQLQQDRKTQDAIAALRQYTKLRPKDATALGQLGSLYLTQATSFARQAQRAQADFVDANPGAVVPSLTASNGQPVFTNPITQPAAQEASNRYNKAVANAQGAYSSAVTAYKSVTKLSPKDAQAQLQLGEAAETSGDYLTAIAAYQQVVKLTPTDPNAPRIRQEMRKLQGLLRQQAAQPATQSSSSG